MSHLANQYRPDHSYADQIEIRPLGRPVDAVIPIPGSKSITNRALLLATLADGTSVLENALFSEDSHWFMECLRRLGIVVEADEAQARLTVHGQAGRFPAASADLFVGNSGTTARFLTAAACLGRGEYRFDGVARMHERPIEPLLGALRGLGARITAQNGRFPLAVHASGLHGGTTELDATESSQYLSALLHISPYAAQDVTVNIVGTVVSRPYIDITLRMMQQFGVTAQNVPIQSSEADAVEPGERSDNYLYRKYLVSAGQRYAAQRYPIEPDASNASYFFAAAAVTGGRVRVPRLSDRSLQGDAHFVDVLEQMGCAVVRAPDYIEVQGPGQLSGVDVNLNAMSDTAQTLAAIAPFASGPVSIRDIGHIRHKETDRIAAIVTELRKLGARVEETTDSVCVYPSTIRPAAVDTYDDHRMAMAFSVIGLVVPGIRINDPGCTRKTFPDFFSRFEGLYA